MTTESLQQVIAAENELQVREQVEREKAVQWLAEQEASISAEFRQRREALTEEMEASRQLARENAKRSATATRNKAEERARRMADVSDALLRRVLARHLIAMITGPSKMRD